MAKMMLAAFTDQAHADQAIAQLEAHGYTSEQISVISNNQKYEAQGHSSTDERLEGAGHGATTGGVIGGLAGLLAGAGMIPALAGLFIGGPIVGALGLAGLAATTAAGAVTGAAAGGLIGALTKAGVSHETAQTYDKIVQGGGVVLGLAAQNTKTEEARAILEQNSAQDMSFVEVPEERFNESRETVETPRTMPAGRPQPAFGERRDMRDETTDI